MWRLLILIFLGMLLLTGILFWAFPEVSLAEGQQIQFVSLALISSYLILAMFQGRLHWSEAAKYIFIWIGLGMVLLTGYAFRDELGEIKNRLTSVLYPSEGTVIRKGEVHFNAASDGHFYVTAMVDGVKIRFMVDTGASRVVISPKDAQRLGLKTEDLIFNSRSSTANGSVWSANTILGTILVEGNALHDVAASVSKDELDVSLLGMSYLEKLKSYKVENGGLTLQY